MGKGITMSQTTATVVTLLSYAVVLVAVVFGIKYGIIDTGTGDLIIGGVLSHFGFNTAPALVQSISPTPTQAQENTSTPTGGHA